MLVTIDSDSMRRDSIKNMMERYTNTLAELPDRKKKVLLFFAEKGEANSYKVSEDCKMQYSTTHSSVKALEKEGFVRLKSEKINEKGVTAKVYTLTLKGLCKAFTVSDALWLKIDVIIDRWSGLLPVLTKFSVFKKHGLEAFFKKSLKTDSSLIAFSEQIHFASYLKQGLIDRATAIGTSGNADFMMKWNRVLHEDPELRQITKLHLELEKRMKEQYLEDITKRLSQVFPKLEQPNPDWDAIRAIELNLQRAHIIL